MPYSIESNKPSAPRQVTVIRTKGVRLGRKHTVEFSYCDGAFGVRRMPSIPTGNKRREVMPSYLRERDAFLRSATTQTGTALAIINPDGSVSVFGGSRS